VRAFGYSILARRGERPREPLALPMEAREDARPNVCRSVSHGVVRLLILLLLLLAANVCRAATNDFFAQGVALTRDGKFPEAVAAFENSAKAQPATGTLINWGVAEWQRGHAGTAILAWEKARWIDPLNQPANQNLRFAREAAQVDSQQLKWFESASTWLPADAWAWLAAASLWLAAGLIVLPGVLRWRKAGWQQALAALAFGVFLFSLTADFGVASRMQIGFVLKKDAPLLLTPTRDAETISTLNAGEPARRLRKRGDYDFIRTPFASGWIRRDQFGLICPEQ
jgi:tetratricopeptide (TPR) repeat protein